MAPPKRSHQMLSYRIHREIDDFISTNHGKCEVNEGVGAKLDDTTLVIPDVMVVCDPSKLDDRYCNGAPDWVIEILSTNRIQDLRVKLGLYQDHGVREYWIVDPVSQKTLVYFFEKSDLPDIYTFDRRNVSFPGVMGWHRDFFIRTVPTLPVQSDLVE